MYPVIPCIPDRHKNFAGGPHHTERGSMPLQALGGKGSEYRTNSWSRAKADWPHSLTLGPNQTVGVVVDSLFTVAVRWPRIEDIAQTDHLEFAVMNRHVAHFCRQY